MKLRVATLLGLLATCSGCGGWGDKDTEPGLTLVDYHPKPVYTYMPELRIRFTTTRPTGPDRKYVVELTTSSKSRTRDCSVKHASEPIGGGAGKAHRVSVTADPNSSTRSCPGKARVVIRAYDGTLSPPLKILTLRILPAHPRGAYSPQDRAVQMAEESYRWRGKDPPDRMTCAYSGTEGSGMQWFSCGRTGIAVACGGETTRDPLTGKSHREYWVWGDCVID